MVLKVKGVQRRRDGIYYFRKVVPVVLRPLLNNRTEFVISLHTNDMATAIARAGVEKSKVEKIITAAQRLHDGDTTDGSLATYKANLTRFLVDFETRLSIERTRPLSPREVRIQHEELVEHLHTLTAKVQAGGPLQGKAGERAAALERVKLLANLDATREILRRMDGDTAGDSQVSPRMTEVWTRYVRERRPGLSLENEYGRAWDSLTVHAGNISVTQLTKATIRSWRDVLLTKPIMAKHGPVKRNGKTIISPATVTKYLNATKAVFTFCMDNDLLAVNPALGVSVPKPSDGEVDAPRISYTSDDLVTIFSSPVHPEPRMLSTLLLVTGMRLNEAVGLRLEDVKTEKDVLYVDVRPYASSATHAGRRVKSKAAVRRCPIHHTIAPAFSRHVQAQRDVGATMVFPDVDAHAWSMRWTRFTYALNLPDRERKQLHSLRHAWQTAAREAGIPDDVRKVLLGHAGGGVAGGYGSWPIATLAEHVNRMVWPEVVLALVQ